MKSADGVAGLRRAQSRAVMPLIGPLLDEWDGAPNDVKADLREQAPGFVEAIEKILSAVEDGA